MNSMNLTGKPVENKVEVKPRSGATIMGIDLGTTNTAVSIYSADRVPMIIPIGAYGKHTLQSCVQWNGGEDFTVGEDAYNHRYEPNAIYSVKRIMGSGKTVTLTLPTGESRTFTPAEISAKILEKVAQGVAEYYEPMKDCVITVPAYFNQRQMGDTIEAAKIAGLNCLRILKEPTSASFVYSLLGYAGNGSVLIYDLGGGTFDVTLMTFLRRDSVPAEMAGKLKELYGIELSKDSTDVTDQYYSKVMGTYGDMMLGGDDIDRYLGDMAIKKSGAKLSNVGREQLYLECEKFKKMGVQGISTTIEGNKIELDVNMLNTAVDAIFERTIKIMADIDMSDVKTIVLVGGSTKSQRLRDDLQAAFPNVEISAVLDPDATVALGAGAVAKAIANNGELDYSDVLPLPIGILVDEKHVEVCLKKNTSMPYSTSRVFHTMHDNQEFIRLFVYQGISSKPENCTYLGCVTIDNIPQKPAGEVSVKVSFVLNGQGRLRIVSHVDGVDTEEELVIDNIFTVAQNDSTEAEKQADADLTGFYPMDDFEEMVVSATSEQAAFDLLTKRRQLAEGDPKRDELEQEVFNRWF